MIEELIIASKVWGKDLLEASAKLSDSSAKLIQLEEKYKVLRAKVLQLERVQNLPSQGMREAEADVILNNDERFKPIYLEYLEAKIQNRKDWLLYETYKELNANVRTMLLASSGEKCQQ